MDPSFEFASPLGAPLHFCRCSAQLRSATRDPGLRVRTRLRSDPRRDQWSPPTWSGNASSMRSALSVVMVFFRGKVRRAHASSSSADPMSASSVSSRSRKAADSSGLKMVAAVPVATERPSPVRRGVQEGSISNRLSSCTASPSCSSMYSLIISSVMVPDVTAKYPLAHRCLPQYCFFRCGNSLEQHARTRSLEPLNDPALSRYRRIMRLHLPFASPEGEGLEPRRGQSNPHILVMQSAQDRTAEYATHGLDSARDRRILVQGQVRARLIVQLDNITPTGPRNGKFCIPGNRGLARWCSFMEG